MNVSPPASIPKEDVIITLHTLAAMDEDSRRCLLAWIDPAAKRMHMSFDEFLAWVDEDTRAELVNGEVILSSPAASKHQEIASFLTTIMRTYAESRALGAVFPAPFLMRLSESTAREPDLLFLMAEHRDRVKPTYLDGPADLVVEIVSPESRARDRGEKFYEYEQAGIPEYWLIDPDTQRAEFYVLGQDARYALSRFDSEGVYHSTVLRNFWLKVAWLWADPLPSALRVLGEIAAVDPSLLAAFEKALRGTD